MQSPNDADLAAALEDWLAAATKSIENNFQNIVSLLPMARWLAYPDGRLRHSPQMPMYRYGLRDEKVFDQNAEWRRVETIAANHERLRKHCGMVGTSLGGGRSLSLRETCSELLPRISLYDSSNARLENEISQKERVAQFIQSINSDSSTVTTVWPIWGLTPDQDIQLDEHTTFRELTTDEKLNCLNMQIIAMRYDEVVPDAARWFGLCHQQTVKKSFGGDWSPDVAAMIQHTAALDQAFEDFFAVALLATDRAMFHAGGIAVAPRLQLQSLWGTGVSGIGAAGGTGLRFLINDPSTATTAETAQILQRLWTFVRNPGRSRFAKRTVTAIRRLFYAETRNRPADTLVDLMIACEALYLDTDKDELKFRLSLNAALWADGVNKRAVLADVRKAYDLRSKIVHGAAVDPEKIKEAVTKMRPLLRIGILKACEQLQTSAQSPEWEAMILGEQTKHFP